jgi:hypothetical protein
MGTIPMSKSLYHQIIDLGERAEHVASVLLREPNRELHRIGVVLRDFANTVADSLKALPESTRKHIACN